MIQAIDRKLHVTQRRHWEILTDLASSPRVVCHGPEGEVEKFLDREAELSELYLKAKLLVEEAMYPGGFRKRSSDKLSQLVSA